MATGSLTEAQSNIVAKILQKTPDSVTDQIEWLGAKFTSQVETDIEAELTRWDTYGDDFEHIHFFAENYGYEEAAESRKNDIRNNIAVILHRPDWKASGSSSSFAVTR